MSIYDRKDVDGLRALAVLPVVLYHASVLGFSGGYFGVDIFFVISGYHITSILLKELNENKFSIVNFYERRAWRILPALFFTLIVTAIAGLFLMSPMI
jgi:peptidoglycan/LPS O-acetylase OafA/YrhL